MPVIASSSSLSSSQCLSSLSNRGPHGVWSPKFSRKLTNSTMSTIELRPYNYTRPVHVQMSVLDSYDNMASIKTTGDFSELQDVLTYMMRIKSFTPICICFPLRAEVSQARIVDILTKGLERLAVGFPWLAGEVTKREKNGLPVIIPGEGQCHLIVKDLTRDPSMPSLEALRTARYPFSMLDGSVLTPISTLKTSWDDEPAPVFLIQANFIEGGILLSFMGEHSTMDGAGLGQIVHLFSKACHGDSFTEEELSQGNRSRRNTIPLLDPTTFRSSTELEHWIYKPEGRPHYEPPKCELGYFHFSRTSLAKLKSVASASSSISDNPAVPYTTTNDAISAFIWKTTSRVRAAHLPVNSVSMFSRTVDIRPCLSLSPFYLGNMIYHTYTKLRVSTAHTTPLSALASELRLALNPTQLAYNYRSLITLLSTAEDRSKIGYGADMNMSSDIWFSSWAKLDCYHLDFNLDLGLPEAVRKPKLKVVEGLMYLMPMDREGGIDASICLMEEDMQRLKADLEWLEYAEWIG